MGKSLKGSAYMLPLSDRMRGPAEAARVRARLYNGL